VEAPAVELAQGRRDLLASLNEGRLASCLSQVLVEVPHLALQAGDETEEQIGELRVELLSAQPLQFFNGPRDRPRLLVGATMRQGIEDVGQRRDARRDRDRSSADSKRITRPIPPLVMEAGYLFRHLHMGYIGLSQ